MRQLVTVAATFLLFGSAQAADLPVTSAQAGVGVYGMTVADRSTVTACETAIAEWALQFNPTNIETAISGPIQGNSGRDRTARLSVQITYERQGDVERRSATIDCKVAANGAVAVAEAQ